MNRLIFMSSVVVMILVPSAILAAPQSHAEKALWIESQEHGNMKTKIAVTEAIARMVLESKDTKVNFSGKGRKDLITKKMLRAVLDGREESVTAKDPDHDQEVKLYLKDLDVPGKERGRDRLVLTTYKEGKKTFSITLPDIEVESKADDESDDLVTRSFGWKAIMPFLAKTGGALYVKDFKDDTEVWLYVE